MLAVPFRCVRAGVWKEPDSFERQRRPLWPNNPIPTNMPPVVLAKWQNTETSCGNLIDDR